MIFATWRNYWCSRGRIRGRKEPSQGNADLFVRVVNSLTALYVKHGDYVMLTTRFVVSIFSVTMMLLSAGVAYGQDYPNKLIRIITSPAGGDNDFIARIIGQSISSPLGQPVVIENRPTPLAVESVAKALPDGYTLLLAGGQLTITPLLRKTSYDAVRDFAPITLPGSSPLILVVHPSLPVKSVRELIALAKARPGELNYGSTGIGGLLHLAGELFKAMAGINIVRISYKGSAEAVNNLLSGELHLILQPPFAVAPHVTSRKLRALAVTSGQPSVLAPGLPTVAASGLPGYEIGVVYGMFAPAKTPARLVDRLNRECVQVLNQPDVRQKFFDSGVESIGSSPAELAAFLKSEMARLGKVIKDVGLRAE